MQQALLAAGPPLVPIDSPTAAASAGAGAGGAADSVVPRIPEHRLMQQTFRKRVRQLNARLDPTYNQPISQVALYKAWLSKRRREAFAASPLAGYVSSHWSSASGSAPASGALSPTAAGSADGGAVATTGALPAHSAVLGPVRRVSTKRLEHAAPFIPSNASEAKRQTARRPVYGQGDPYDAAHRLALEQVLASRTRQHQPDTSHSAGGAAAAPHHSGHSSGGGQQDRPPFYPTRPSEAKAQIEIGYTMYSDGELLRRRARESTHDRALANSRLFRAKFMALSDSDDDELDAAAAAAAAAASHGGGGYGSDGDGGDGGDTFDGEHKQQHDEALHRGSQSARAARPPDTAQPHRRRRHRHLAFPRASGPPAAATAQALAQAIADARAAAAAQAAAGSRAKGSAAAAAPPAAASASAGLPAATIAAVAAQLPKHSHLLTPAQLAHFVSAPKFSSHIHTTYYPTAMSRSGSNRSSMADLLGDPALSMAGLSEDKSKLVRNKRGEWVPAAHAQGGAYAADRKPKLPAFGLRTTAAAPTAAPPKLHHHHPHGKGPKPAPPPIKTVSVLRHYFAE